MKLLLTWLVGVPALVAAMVLARAMSPQGMRAPQVLQTEVQQRTSCSRQVDLDKVLASIPQDGHRVACQRTTVQ